MLVHAPTILHAKLQTVCPVVTLSIKPDGTMDFVPGAAATPAQIAAAKTMLAAVTLAKLAAADATVANAISAVVDPIAAAKAAAAAAL